MNTYTLNGGGGTYAPKGTGASGGKYDGGGGSRGTGTGSTYWSGGEST